MPVAVVPLHGRVVGRAAAAEDGSTAARIVAIGDDESDMLVALAEALGMAEVDAAAVARSEPIRGGGTPAPALRCLCRYDEEV